MSDNGILGQDEINQLLSSISLTDGTELSDENCSHTDPETLPGRIKLYDFRRPQKFSDDFLYDITRFHKGFAKLLVEHISRFTDKNISINVLSADQLLFEEFQCAIPELTALGTYQLGPKAPFIVEMDYHLSRKLLKAYLGGSRLTFRDIHPFSGTEKKVLGQIFQDFSTPLSRTWEPVTGKKTGFSSFEHDPAFINIIPPEEMVCLVTLEMQFSDHAGSGMINICYPYTSISPFLVTTGGWEKKDNSSLGKPPFYLNEELEQHLFSSYAVFPGNEITVNTLLYPAKSQKVDSLFKEKGTLRYE